MVLVNFVFIRPRGEKKENTFLFLYIYNVMKSSKTFLILCIVCVTQIIRKKHSVQFCFHSLFVGKEKNTVLFLYLEMVYFIVFGKAGGDDF